jgi:hypothetical protein
MGCCRTKRISHHAYVFAFTSKREVHTSRVSHYHSLPISNLSHQEYFAYHECSQQRGPITREKCGILLVFLRTFQESSPGIRNDSLAPPFAEAARKVCLETAHE